MDINVTTSKQSDSEGVVDRGRRWLHPAWKMVLIAGAALLASGSYTTVAGLITEPLVMSEGWSRSDIGVAVAINMVLYGAVAPFSAAAMDRYGLRKVTTSALTLLVASSVLLTTLSSSVGMFILWWGVLVGIGTGSITMVFGATVANRWFADHLGLATGILTASSVVGQFAMLPVLSVVMSHYDWRAPVLVCGALAAIAAILVVVFLRGAPSELGVERYGLNSAIDTPDVTCDQEVLTRTLSVLLECIRSPRFWLLASMFFLCGATTNGLMWSHFTPAAHDHGMMPTTASTLLAIIGFANILGTVSAGWFTDRLEPRSLLALFFLSRGITLAVLPLIFGRHMDPSLIAFAVGFGILDVATVPPTIALCRHYFGANSALAFGWVNVFHQIGAGAMALTGGLIRDANGTYTLVWIVGAILCVVAAGLGAVSAKIHVTGGSKLVPGPRSDAR
ncbi:MULTISPECIES: MFS transporter [unclassified Rhodococcus (in: high G+C Gram-positive bacteria)]|uniref:MFS transporter n=1 Tax=unclassified Rhodococcus (in: high G+C Gram-positive bacteria) TaxID=192944 RepID=UPI0033917592